jgi:hypothetical protein
MEEGQKRSEVDTIPRAMEVAGVAATAAAAAPPALMGKIVRKKNLKKNTLEMNEDPSGAKKAKVVTEHHEEKTISSSEEMTENVEMIQEKEIEEVNNGRPASSEKGEETENMVETCSIAEMIVLLKFTLQDHAHAEVTSRFISIFTEMNAQLMELQKENKMWKEKYMEGSTPYGMTPKEEEANQTKNAKAAAAGKTAPPSTTTVPIAQTAEKGVPVSSPQNGTPIIPATKTSLPWGKKKSTAEKVIEITKDKTQDEILKEILQSTETDDNQASHPKLTKITVEATFSVKFMKLAPMARWKLLMKNIGTGVCPKNIMMCTSRIATIYITEAEMQMMKANLPSAVKIVPEVECTNMIETKRLAAAYLRSFCGPLRELVLSEQNTFSKVNILNQALNLKKTPAWKNLSGIVKASTIEWDLRHWKEKEDKEDEEQKKKENSMEGQEVNHSNDINQQNKEDSMEQEGGI